MLYLHFHDCRLTLSEPLMFGSVNRRCPRCTGRLHTSPPELFDRSGTGSAANDGTVPFRSRADSTRASYVAALERLHAGADRPSAAA